MNNYLVIKIPKENTANLMFFLKQFKNAKIIGTMYEANILPDYPVKNGNCTRDEQASGTLR
jgi:hypothetical protein